MARRKQLRGIAGNLCQWCLSRNFDYKGYWAIGQMYASSKENITNELVVKLVEKFTFNKTFNCKFSEPINLLNMLLIKELEANKIPVEWVQDVTIVFKFNTEFKNKYHLFGSECGGKPFICIVEITSDLNKSFRKECGCNVWTHNPKREQCRII